jgi:hypothetical protein
LLDACLAEVVAHALERVGGCAHPPDRHRKRGHEIDQPAEERPAFQKVVVALDEGGRGLEPRERLDLPFAFGNEPAPDAGARGKPVGSIRLQDDERVGHGL